MRIQNVNLSTYANVNHKNNRKNITVENSATTPQTRLPYNYRYNANISFGEFFDPNRTVPHIDYEEYIAMQKSTKQRFRKQYNNFHKKLNKDEMFDNKDTMMPLRSERNMDEFLKTAKLYSKYKDQPIICLGRSPKWFLNAALWMKDGIDEYKFVAFSKFWFRPDSEEGIKRMDSVAPTEKEEAAYFKYLKRVKADPQTIVDNFEKTGKKTVITDYICSGKGACSFLDLMSKYAEEAGILEEFSKSIQIVGIGSREYLEDLNPYAESISDPSVPMPPRLRPYKKNIKQEFYNMDYSMFKEMLLNQNTNECRSTYYPHEAWTVYKPDRFKTGLVKDIKKVKEVVKNLKGNNKSMASFTPAMCDYRNLLNFKILDALFNKDLLKTVHKSKL